MTIFQYVIFSSRNVFVCLGQGPSGGRAGHVGRPQGVHLRGGPEQTHLERTLQGIS